MSRRRLEGALAGHGPAMPVSRLIALGFGATHVLMCAAAAAAPVAYGRPWLGDSAEAPAARAALRGLAVCDALPAVLVVDAVVRRRPLAARLAVGVVSDLGRAATALTGRRAAPAGGNTAMIAASLAGATIATSLLPHVDAHVGD
jgi:hypothetical protein